MPAPTPISFQSDLSVIAPLALAAGAITADRQDFARQQQIDAQILRDEMARRQRESEINAQFRTQQIEQDNRRRNAERQRFALQRASRQIALDRRNEQAFANRQAVASRPSAFASAIPAGSFVQQAPGRTPSGTVSGPAGTFQSGAAGITQTAAPAPPEGGRELIDPATGQLRTDFAQTLQRDLAAEEFTPRPAQGLGVTGIAPQVLPVEVAQQRQILSQARRLPTEDRQILESAINAGGLSTQQLLNEIQQREPKLNDGRKIDGLTVEQRSLEIQRLQRRRFAFNDENDPDNATRDQIDTLIETERANIRKQQAMSGTPQLTGRSLATANPKPDGQGRPLGEADAIRFLQQANGDANLARSLARDAGFVIPQ